MKSSLLEDSYPHTHTTQYSTVWGQTMWFMLVCSKYTNTIINPALKCTNHYTKVAPVSVSLGVWGCVIIMNAPTTININKIFFSWPIKNKKLPWKIKISLPIHMNKNKAAVKLVIDHQLNTNKRSSNNQHGSLEWHFLNHTSTWWLTYEIKCSFFFLSCKPSQLCSSIMNKIPPPPNPTPNFFICRSCQYQYLPFNHGYNSRKLHDSDISKF